MNHMIPQGWRDQIARESEQMKLREWDADRIRAHLGATFDRLIDQQTGPAIEGERERRKAEIRKAIDEALADG